ncbi:hypothetical protein [Nocardia sp. NPDC049707]|uniref:hypothetical protein n=1 Tax=Nocardia sp. NPDC049707 TaxID=3154735 RepID=UPI003417E5C9
MTYPEELIDDLIDEWQHGNGLSVSLPEFLGMTEDQYARFVMCKMPVEELAAWAAKRQEDAV